MKHTLIKIKSKVATQPFSNLRRSLTELATRAVTWSARRRRAPPWGLGETTLRWTVSNSDVQERSNQQVLKGGLLSPLRFRDTY